MRKIITDTVTSNNMVKCMGEHSKYVTTTFVWVSPGRRSCGRPVSASGWSLHLAWPSRCGTGDPGRWSSAAGRRRGESRYSAAGQNPRHAPLSSTSPHSVYPLCQKKRAQDKQVHTQAQGSKHTRLLTMQAAISDFPKVGVGIYCSYDCPTTLKVKKMF